MPAKDKMSAPKYQAIQNKQIPRVPVHLGEVEVIAGTYQSTQGAASTFTPVNLLNVKLEYMEGDRDNPKIVNNPIPYVICWGNY
jgi:redox-sensitive bicupin YhaK (pirin superfamily)